MIDLTEVWIRKAPDLATKLESWQHCFWATPSLYVTALTLRFQNKSAKKNAPCSLINIEGEPISKSLSRTNTEALLNYQLKLSECNKFPVPFHHNSRHTASRFNTVARAFVVLCSLPAEGSATSRSRHRGLFRRTWPCGQCWRVGSPDGGRIPPGWRKQSESEPDGKFLGRNPVSHSSSPGKKKRKNTLNFSPRLNVGVWLIQVIGVRGCAVCNKSKYLAFEGGGKKSETGKFWFALNNNLYFAHRDVVSLASQETHQSWFLYCKQTK